MRTCDENINCAKTTGQATHAECSRAMNVLLMITFTLKKRKIKKHGTYPRWINNMLKIHPVTSLNTERKSKSTHQELFCNNYFPSIASSMSSPITWSGQSIPEIRAVRVNDQERKELIRTNTVSRAVPRWKARVPHCMQRTCQTMQDMPSSLIGTENNCQILVRPQKQEHQIYQTHIIFQQSVHWDQQDTGLSPVMKQPRHLWKLFNAATNVTTSNKLFQSPIPQNTGTCRVGPKDLPSVYILTCSRPRYCTETRLKYCSKVNFR